MNEIAIKQVAEATAGTKRRRTGAEFIRRNPTILIGGTLLAIIIFVSVAAPLLTAYDPLRLTVVDRLQPPSAKHLFGTDAYGRDIFSRTLYGGRVSLLVGLGVPTMSIVVGCLIGLVSGFFRKLDSIVMRVMDGLMAIPGVLLAVAMMALLRPSLIIVMVALTVTEVPRVVRLVRALALTIREQPYVEAAVSVGTKMPRLLLKHVLPNMVPPLIVQATYICALAVLGEATLSFLGVGVPPEIPSWGNIIAESRILVQIAIWTVLFPGLFLGFMVLAINMLGDGLRDMFDPRIARTA
jgi:peptide/nickel transport system permease protein